MKPPSPIKPDALLLVGVICVVASAALAMVACGGKSTGEGTGNDGGGGDSAPSGSSSGSSSGGSSGGSGSSSGGNSSTCTPLAGCSSTVYCPVPGGCGGFSCINGQWVGSDVGVGCEDASPATCPASEPNEGDACTSQGLTCSYGQNCPSMCSCYGGTWSCIVPPCVPHLPPCPQNAPADSSPCSATSQTCNYGTGCLVEDCQCMVSSLWSCSTVNSCIDAGVEPHDAAPAD
jgi:hypothetical protein